MLRRWIEWYRHPDREFLRAEARRTGRWLWRGGGAGWLGLYALALVAQAILTLNVRPGISGYGSLGSALLTTIQYSWIFALPFAVAFVAWAGSLRARTFAPLAPDRVGDLLLTAVGPRELWPALLIAPVALRIGMAALASAAGFVTFTIWLLRDGPPLDTYSVPVWMGYRVYGSVVGLIVESMRLAATTAWAAWLIHPGGSVERVLVRAGCVVAGFMVLEATIALVSQALLFQSLSLFFPLNFRDTRMPLSFQMAFFPGIVLRLVVYAVLFGWAVGRLRSAEAMEVLRARAGR
jgi:hypothetical protein